MHDYDARTVVNAWTKRISVKLFWDIGCVVQLVDDYTTDAQVQALVDKYQFYLLPIVNPDGYDYTWTDVNTLDERFIFSLTVNAIRGTIKFS